MLLEVVSTLLEDTGHTVGYNPSLPHICWNEAEEEAKLNCILAQGRRFPVLQNLHETNCPRFVLVWGRK